MTLAVTLINAPITLGVAAVSHLTNVLLPRVRAEEDAHITTAITDGLEQLDLLLFISNIMVPCVYEMLHTDLSLTGSPSFTVVNSTMELMAQAAARIRPPFLLQLSAEILAGNKHFDLLTLVCTNFTPTPAVSGSITQDILGKNILVKESNLKRVGFVHSLYPNS